MAKEDKKAKTKSEAKAGYGAKDIFVLEGLEPVRKRPGMYIGSTGPTGLHHLLWEIFDNALDEAMAGHAKHIEVTLLPNNRARIADDGRGIPVEIHPQTKKSTLETVLTTLHAGGKFGGGAYKVSGGLHGVGGSVVNALSTYLKAEVARDGYVWSQEYSVGIPKTKVTKGVKAPGTGTTITFEPDKSIFPEAGEFDWKTIIDHLREQAYLTKGVHISVYDERTEKPKAAKASSALGENVFGTQYSFYFEGGVTSFVRYLTRHEVLRHNTIFHVEKQKENVHVEVAFCYAQSLSGFEYGFANNIHTPEGGMHVTGFRTALTRTLNDYARKQNFVKENEDNLSSEDVHEGLTALISVKIPEPQFEGQTKAKLGNPEARTAVDSVVAEALVAYLEQHPQDARAILEQCIIAQKARKAAKAARDTVLRKGLLEGLALPGKLADCQSKDPQDSELYIVEGDSAGGSAKQARDRKFQAILPLRGKILNVERARLDRTLTSDSIRSLIIAIGTAVAEEFDLAKLRYHRIILMTDADVDGAHIRTLLLTLFWRYFRPVIEAGHLYIAEPPLFRIQKGKNVKYAYSDAELEKLKSEEGVALYDPTTKKNIDGQMLKEILDYVAQYNNLSEILQSKGLHPKLSEALLLSRNVRLVDDNDEGLDIVKTICKTIPGASVNIGPEVKTKRTIEVSIENESINLEDKDLKILESNDFKQLIDVYTKAEKLTKGLMITKNNKREPIQGIGEIVNSIFRSSGSSTGLSIQRYKGLGEMNPEQLWETTMDPARRVMRKVAFVDAKHADEVFEMLMGDDVAPRKKFISTHATKVKNLDI